MATKTRKPLPGSRFRLLFGAALTSLCLLLAPKPLQAASCCGSVLAQGDRLGPDEKASLHLGLGGSFITGWFSPQGRFEPLSPGSLHFDGQGNLSLAFRLSRDFQIGLNGGWQQGVRDYGETLATGGALKDASLGLRYQYESSAGSLALQALVSFPLGRTVEESRALLAADVSGRGSYGGRIAASYEHYFNKWFVMGELGLGATGPERSSGVDANGSLDFTLMSGYTFRKAAVLGLGLNGMLAPAWSRNGVPLSQSLRSKVGLALAGGLPLTHGLRGTASLRVDPPIYASRNESMDVVLNLGLRWLLW